MAQILGSVSKRRDGHWRISVSQEGERFRIGSPSRGLLDKMLVSGGGEKSLLNVLSPGRLSASLLAHCRHPGAAREEGGAIVARRERIQMTRTRSRIHLALPLLLAISCQTPVAAKGSAELMAFEREAAERVNAHRKASNLTPFSYDARVAEIARGHSERMASGKSKLDHDGFQSRANRIAKFLPLAGAAENVSKHQRKADFAEIAVKKWLASKVHRKNIDGDYAVTGIGAARSKEGVVYFTQLFIRVR